MGKFKKITENFFYEPITRRIVYLDNNEFYICTKLDEALLYVLLQQGFTLKDIYDGSYYFEKLPNL